MKIRYAIAGAVVAGAVSLALAPTASAWTTDQDAKFVSLATSNGITFPSYADGALAGETIASALASGVSPIAERNYIYVHTNNTVGIPDANVLVNAAEIAYFGAKLTQSGWVV
jgi:hypothetical protein